MYQYIIIVGNAIFKLLLGKLQANVDDDLYMKRMILL